MLNASIAAFFGAFFAFIFLRIADVFKSLYDRQKLNFISLVNLEYLLNHHLSDLTDNIFEINQIELQYNKAIQEDKIVVSSNWPQPVTFPSKIAGGLLNIDLINELFIYSDRLKKLNNSIERVNQFYSEFRTALLSRTIQKENYLRNFGVYANKVIELRKHIQDIKIQTKNLFATVRVITGGDMPLYDKVFQFFYKKKYPKNHHELIKKELSILDQQIKISEKESIKEIHRIYGNKNEHNLNTSTMKFYFIYGTKGESFDALKNDLSKIFSIELEVHESNCFGVYAQGQNVDFAEIKLYPNYVEGEGYHLPNKEYQYLLSIEDPNNIEQIDDILNKSAFIFELIEQEKI